MLNTNESRGGRRSPGYVQGRPPTHSHWMARCDSAPAQPPDTKFPSNPVQTYQLRYLLHQRTDYSKYTHTDAVSRTRSIRVKQPTRSVRSVTLACGSVRTPIPPSRKLVAE